MDKTKIRKPSKPTTVPDTAETHETSVINALVVPDAATFDIAELASAVLVAEARQRENFIAGVWLIADMLEDGRKQSGLSVTRYSEEMAAALGKSESYVTKYLRFATIPTAKRQEVKAKTFRGLWNELFPATKPTIETDGEEVPDADAEGGDDGEVRDALVAPKDRFRCDDFVRAVSELSSHVRELDRCDAGSCVALVGSLMIRLGEFDAELAEQVRKTLPQIDRACRRRKKRRASRTGTTAQVRP